MRPLAIAREDLRMTLRDGGALFWMFLAPVMWVYFFSFVARGSDASKTRIGLGVTDVDQSATARRLVTLLGGESFDVSLAGPGQGKEAPARRLTIPAGFGAAIAQRQKVTLTLTESDKANPEGTLAAQVAMHKAVVRLLADEVLGPSATPDAITVRAAYAGRRKTPSGYYQTLPGNLVMFVLLTTITSGGAMLARDRMSGLLRRLATTPLTRSEIIAGKMLGRMAMASLQVLVFIVIGVVFRIDWGDSPVALLLLLASLVLCAGGFGMLAGAVFPSPGAASGIGVVATLAMAALGGCWWPAEVMPEWMQRAGLAFPTGWAMQGLHQVLSWQGGVAQVVAPAVVLAAFGLATFFLAARLLRV